MERKGADLVGRIRRGVTAGALVSCLAVAPTTLHAQDAITLAPPSGRVLIDGSSQSIDLISAPALGRDGRILIAQRFEHYVAVYDGAGRLLWRFGREGDGPGEFRRIVGAGFAGSVAWVSDALHQRTTYIRDGRFVESRQGPSQLRRGSTPERVNGSPVLAMLPDGSLLLEARTPGTSPFPANWTGRDPRGNEVAIVRADSTGLVTKILAWTRDQNRCQPGGPSLLPVPFCRPPLRAISPSGEWIATISGDRDPAGGFRLRITNADGKVTAEHQVESPRQPVSRAAFDALKQSYRSFVNKPPGFDEAVDRLQRPSYYPAARRMLVSDDGRVAVELWHEQPWQSYRIFSRDGAELPTLGLARNETLEAMASGYLLVVRKDEDDVPSLVRYDVP